MTRHNQIDMRSVVQFSPQAVDGIIIGWLHCLMSESKGRFLVNNILMFGSAWCLVMAQIQFSLIKKAKIGRPEHLLTLHPLHPITSHFCLPHPLHPPPPIKVDVICVSHPMEVDIEQCHYLPYRTIIINDKTSTKISIAYDGSSKMFGQSLSECLYPGPLLVESLFCISWSM